MFFKNTKQNKRQLKTGVHECNLSAQQPEEVLQVPDLLGLHSETLCQQKKTKNPNKTKNMEQNVQY